MGALVAQAPVHHVAPGGTNTSPGETALAPVDGPNEWWAGMQADRSRQGDMRLLMLGAGKRAPQPARPKAVVYTEEQLAQGMAAAAAVAQQSHAADHEGDVHLWASRFSQFLTELPPLHGGMQVTMADATPAELLAFCAMKVVPEHGRTVIRDGSHVPAFSTLKGVLSFLRYAFLTIGREGEWIHARSRGNPCESFEVRQYRTGYERFLWAQGIEAVAAVPLTEAKLHALVCKADESVVARTVQYGARATPSQRMHILILERDVVVYIYLWESWQRGSEGGRLRP